MYSGQIMRLSANMTFHTMTYRFHALNDFNTSNATCLGYTNHKQTTRTQVQSLNQTLP